VDFYRADFVNKFTHPNSSPANSIPVAVGLEDGNSEANQRHYFEKLAQR